MLDIIGSSSITNAVCVESAMYVSSIEGCFSRPVEVSDLLLLHIWNSSLVGAGPLEGCGFAPIFAARAGEDRAAKPRAGEANEEDAVELGLPPSQSSGRSGDTDEEDAHAERSASPPHTYR